ncbi:hypothetical protein ACFXKC_45940 [Streptomyces sp. NPDC059340]|uniref:hypothetical protein n=1 Tax=Streptomyces sp. NPDC059340 TaxID=3346806 RepID=UPI003677AC11
MDGLYVVRHEPTWREEPEPEPDDEYDNSTDHKTVYALWAGHLQGQLPRTLTR